MIVHLESGLSGTGGNQWHSGLVTRSYRNESRDDADLKGALWLASAGSCAGQGNEALLETVELMLDRDQQAIDCVAQWLREVIYLARHLLS